ncbi:MAG: sulfatase activating formylglycine-generating enzyme [Phycisphaerales bacterium]|jgi:formylglycine-generating enzyme required for sulfatase activity
MINRAVLMMSVVCLVSPMTLAQALGGDTEWAAIGAVGNRGFDRARPDFPRLGRGAVNYPYRLAVHEVTTAQWIEFMNAVNGLDEHGDLLRDPLFWGGRYDGNTPDGGRRVALVESLGPNAALLPVSGIGWRLGARFVNWLHNGKLADPATLGNGVYDTSTFGNPDDGPFTDILSPAPGAQYWIPTFDEWIKAVHYDPERVNEDESLGGWWYGPHGSDELPLAGLPWVGGETSGGLDLEVNEAPPVGSYAARTPWGLADASGGVMEWTSSIWVEKTFTNQRLIIDGSSMYHDDSNALILDYLYLNGAEFIAGGIPSLGLRLAATALAEVPCAADFNADGLVEFADLRQFVESFLNRDPASDLNGDGVVDFGDIMRFVEAYVRGCDPS